MEIVIQLHPLLPAQYPMLAPTSCLLRDMVSGHDRDGLDWMTLVDLSNLNDSMFYLQDSATERNTAYEKLSQATVMWERDTAWSLSDPIPSQQTL